MSDGKNSLELFVASHLQDIDPKARPTRGSGCGNEIGDVSNTILFVECKQKLTKDNITMRYKEEWLDLLKKMPMTTNKIPVVVIENAKNEKFVFIQAEDFFKILKEAKNGNG